MFVVGPERTRRLPAFVSVIGGIAAAPARDRRGSFAAPVHSDAEIETAITMLGHDGGGLVVMS